MTYKTIIGIPTYNGYYRVDNLLHSISLRSSTTDKQILQNSIIVVCDDSGKKEHQELTKNVVSKWKSSLPIEIIINETNRGVASSWNRSARFSDSDNIILINDDIIVSNGWLDSMIYFLDNNPKAGSCSHHCYFITTEDIPILLSTNDSIVTPRDPFKKTPTEVYEDKLEFPGRVMAPAGCFFGVRRDIFNQVNGFDENYRCFYEESDFGTTLASKGYPTYMLCYPKNWHIWSQTFTNAPEINASYVMNQSRQYYIQKWNGHFEVTHPRYMNKIPFQKIKFKYKDSTYEKVINAEHGYFENDEGKNGEWKQLS